MSRARIDVHHHFLPDPYRAALAAADVNTIGTVPFPVWDAESMLARLDQLEIARALLSISAPGVAVGRPEKHAVLARDCNESAAALVDGYPDRIGFFASLPLPDVDAALREIHHSLDVLGADGVVLFTNHAGCYLGDEHLEPIMEELDRRGAVAFVHPALPPGATELGRTLQPPVLEFTFDTTRAIADMIAIGFTVRYPNVRMILAHLGGALPFLAWRLSMLEDTAHPVGQGFRRFGVSVQDCLRAFYYEVATAGPEAVRAAATCVGSDRLLFGSDVPFIPPAFLDRTLAELDTLDVGLRQDIDRGNANRAFGWT